LTVTIGLLKLTDKGSAVLDVQSTESVPTCPKRHIPCLHLIRFDELRKAWAITCITIQSCDAKYLKAK